jgi:hypothetical protein
MPVNTETGLEMESVDSQPRPIPSIKVLLADTDRRSYTARLAMAFAAVGCEVSAVCTSHNPIETIKARPQLFPYSAVRPKLSLLHAIQSVNPDLIVPCDDRAVLHLQQLCGQPGLNASVIKVIERSLGPSGSFPVVSARYPLLELAKEQGIRVPATQYLETEQDLDEWLANQPFPWVLKADGTWGGGGVRIVESATDVDGLFRTLSQPCKFRHALRRLIVHRDSFYLRDWWQRNTRSLIAQAFVAGRHANCAVACWEGKILSQINVEVLATSVPTGPAKMVRLIENPEMDYAAERIAQKLQLSGFFGLDFIIEDKTRNAYLLEMNPRCTPLSHIHFEPGTGLIPALYAALVNQPQSTGPHSPANRIGEAIAYFPQAQDSKGNFKEPTFYDFPHDEPKLAEALAQLFPRGTFLYRIFDHVSSYRE